MEDKINEIWKNIDGYEGLYQISNLGRVKSLGNEKNRKERILKLTKNKKTGYLQVGLHKEGKAKRINVHRLVASAFIENPNNLPFINHIDEDKTNNSVSNLEWCDAKYNNNYGTRNKRIGVAFSKKVLCLETGVTYSSTMDANIQTGINQSNISKCCLGNRKTAGGYHWQYI